MRRLALLLWLLAPALPARGHLPESLLHRRDDPAYNLNHGTNTWSITANSPGATTINQTSYLPATVNFRYDANGNLTNDGSRVYSYDTENRLRQIYYVGVGYSVFTYDVFGRLRGRDEWQGVTDLTIVVLSAARYVYDGPLVVQEWDQSNVVKVTYTRGLDLSGTRAGAGGIGGLLARTTGTNHAYYHADGAGNVTALTDYEGSVVARYHYDPFGRLIYKLGPLADANVYRFSSKEQHLRSGLSYFGARFYDPTMQKWITRDPLGEARGVNLYEFVENDPADLADPFGLQVNEVSSATFKVPVDAPNQRSLIFYPPAPRPPPDAAERLNDGPIQSADSDFIALSAVAGLPALASASYRAGAAGLAETLQAARLARPCVAKGPLRVDPAGLRLPATRAEGADPFKLADQIKKYGTSTEGMPPIQVTRGANGEMMINDGVTRATRGAMTPGTTVPVQVIEENPALNLGNLPKVGERTPGRP